MSNSNETVEEAADTLLSEYGGKALENLRQTQRMVELVAALGHFRGREWAEKASEWQRAIASMVGQLEEAHLTSYRSQALSDVALPTEEFIAKRARNHETITLRVQRVGGASREDVEVEPYSILGRGSKRVLFCWNVAHAHPERMAMDRIIYAHADRGESFRPRYEVEL